MPIFQRQRHEVTDRSCGPSAAPDRRAEYVAVHAMREPVRLAFDQAHPRHETDPSRDRERAHRRHSVAREVLMRPPRIIFGELALGRQRRVGGPRHLGEAHLLMREVGVVCGPETPCHPQRGPVDAVDTKVAGDLRGAESGCASRRRRS